MNVCLEQLRLQADIQTIACTTLQQQQQRDQEHQSRDSTQARLQNTKNNSHNINIIQTKIKKLNIRENKCLKIP